MKILTDTGLMVLWNKIKQLVLGNRPYNPSEFSGKGYKVLEKNIQTVGGVKKNILTAVMINQPNTIYEVRYDFDLDGEEITIKEGCTLKFDGGSLNNGKIIFSLTKIIGSANISCDFAGKIEGNVYANWFGIKSENYTIDNSKILQKIGDVFSSFIIEDGFYYCLTPIDWSKRKIHSITCNGTLYYGKKNTDVTFIKLSASLGNFYFKEISGPVPDETLMTDEEKSIGIDFAGCTECKVHVDAVTGFHTNVKISSGTSKTGSSTKYANGYNEYYFTSILKGKILVHIDNGYWINSNTFAFRRLTNYGVNNADAAIFISKRDGASDFDDNVVSVATIEGIQTEYPIKSNGITGFTFYDIRNEKNNSCFINTSYIANCKFIFGYGYSDKIKSYNSNKELGPVYNTTFEDSKNHKNKYEVNPLSMVKTDEYLYAPPFVSQGGNEKLDKECFFNNQYASAKYAGFIIFDIQEVKSRLLEVDTGANQTIINISYYNSEKQLIVINEYPKPSGDKGKFLRDETASDKRFYSYIDKPTNIYIPELPDDVKYVGIGISINRKNGNQDSVYPFLEINAECSKEFHKGLQSSPSICVVSGTTRPTYDLHQVGRVFFDTLLNKPIYWTGSKWVDSTGTDI